MEKIQEGQPFTIFVEHADTPAQLEKNIRQIKKLLPKGTKIFGVMYQSQRKKALSEKLAHIFRRYCDTLYYAPSFSNDESGQLFFENTFRKADFGDCILILGSRQCGAVREAARQVAYEMDLL